ncbi:MAG: Lysine-tRNA ligase [candidate division TM6 bacterium GW2011_GWF2_28_16]|jgi:lysyl-tRNA synthetase class 2|nr:MAG: Lysine-tRNA ligase [candidate division TM6 bacterium GW2011_GWF2_28_16]
MSEKLKTNVVVDQQENKIVNEDLVRLNKVKELESKGISPWPAYKKVEHTCAKVIYDFEHEISQENDYIIAGRLITIRDHGKSVFANLRDRSGDLQIYIKKDDIGEEQFNFFMQNIDAGDIVWAKGKAFKTKLGEITLKVSQVSLLSKCLHALPEKFHGLVDVEQRYRQRYLDLMSNPETKAKFIKRSKIIQTIRNFLLEKEFLEVETPMLHPIPGGANARPFITHHNAYNMDLYLRIAPELYLKRLVVGGIERVFEINRNFRNEGVSTRHNPEFTMLEFYMAHGDYKDGIALTEEMFSSAANKVVGSNYIKFGDKEIDFTAPFRKLTMRDSLVEIAGLKENEISEENIDKTLKSYNLEVVKTAGYGAKVSALFEELVEEKIVQPTFIIGYPIEISPLAKRDPEKPNFAARFELFVAGMELANGFTELNDPFDQADRFRSQVEARGAGDEEAHHYDGDYIKALEYGLSPAVGVGVGLDRLTMLLTDTTSIKDVILFPTLKNIE